MRREDILQRWPMFWVANVFAPRNFGDERGRRVISIVLLAGMVWLVSCSRRAPAANRGSGVKQSAAIAASVSPIATLEFDPRGDAALATAFSTLPPTAARRAELSQLYRARKFGTLATVFDAAIPESDVKATPAVRWLCESPEVDVTEAVALGNIRRLRESGEFDEAVRACDTLLKSHPASCQVRVERSDSVLRRALIRLSSGVSFEARPEEEWAIRTLLTAATEVVEVPQGRIGSAEVIRDTSLYFGAKGDRVTERRLLVLALKTIPEDVRLNPVLEQLKGFAAFRQEVIDNLARK